MSQGNVSIASDTSPGEVRTNEALIQFVRQGKSFSGHERNCCFLNTGSGGRFADVSAVSGLDFRDDARGIAVTDWDLDGDLDFWILNRSGPQIRFLRNDVPAHNHFLAVQLVGTTSNRDAIGARVELMIEGASERKSIQTLGAGNGFLAQSSKWIHFGLGDTTQIDHLVVHWPGGEIEEFTPVEADRRYKIVQGSGEPKFWSPPTRRVDLTPSSLTPVRSDEPIRILLSTRLPIPQLKYESFEGEMVPLHESLGQPVLVNLWASWCLPCLAELKEFTKHEQRLRQSGLRMVALSVDGLDSNNTDKPEEVLERLQFPFDSGRVDAGVVDKLEVVQNELFGRWLPLGVPTSFLLDGQGRLAAIYRGTLPVDRLLTDVDRINMEGAALRKAALPFEGRSFSRPQGPEVLRIARALVKAGHLHDAVSYVTQNRQYVGQTKTDYAKLLGNVGMRLLDDGDLDAALKLFREVRRVSPELAPGHFGLAKTLMALRDIEASIPHFREAIRLKPDLIVARFGLARALIEQGQAADAVTHLTQLLRIRSDHTAAQIHLAWLLATHSDPTIRDGPEALYWAQNAAAATDDKSYAILDTLGAAYAESGQFDDAVAATQSALQLAQESKQDHRVLTAIEERLRLYETGQAFREDTGETIE